MCTWAWRKKERLIALDVRAFLTINEYFGEMRVARNNGLFLNRCYEPLGERGIQKMLTRYLKGDGIKHAGIRTLRHAFGVH